jgi:hypothetical protein
MRAPGLSSLDLAYDIHLFKILIKMVMWNRLSQRKGRIA